MRDGQFFHPGRPGRPLPEPDGKVRWCRGPEGWGRGEGTGRAICVSRDVSSNAQPWDGADSSVPLGTVPVSTSVL